MVMQPFDDSDSGVKAWVTLSRVWCVFELYSCEATLSEFHVTMTAKMADRFRREMLCQDRGWLATLASLDCKRSEATDPKDKERVFDVIQRTIGFPLLNSLVMRVMEKWLASSFLSAVREASDMPLDYPQLVQTVTEVVEAFQRRRAIMAGISRDHPDSLASMHTLACLYQEQGKSNEAMAMCKQCLLARERVLGADHGATMASKRLLTELSGGTYVGVQVIRHDEVVRGEASLGASLVIPTNAPVLVLPRRVDDEPAPNRGQNDGTGVFYHGVL